MKKTMISIVLGAITFGASVVSPVMASTKPLHFNYEQTQIAFNGTVVDSPKAFVYNSTTYVPVWYVMHALDSLGIRSNWKNGNWYMTLPSADSPDLTNIHSGTGTNGIYVNGTLVQKVYGIPYIDPSSGNDTEFMPIWYVMQILKRVAYDSGWKNSEWSIANRSIEMNAFNTALSNANSPLNGQLSGTMNINMNLNLTQKGKVDLAVVTLPPMTIQLKFGGQTGMVDGQKAALMTTTTTKDTIDSTTPGPQEVYIVGNTEYSNTGSGWQLVQNSNLSAQQLIQSQLPTLQQQAFGNVTATPFASGYQFNSTADLSSDGALMSQMVGSLQSGLSDSLTPSQMQSILKNAKTSIQMTLPQSANEFSNETVSVQMMIPASDLFTGTDAQTQQELKDISSMNVNEAIDINFDYNQTALVPPTGLPSTGISTSNATNS